jgi:hypothetical protein
VTEKPSTTPPVVHTVEKSNPVLAARRSSLPPARRHENSRFSFTHGATLELVGLAAGRQRDVPAKSAWDRKEFLDRDGDVCSWRLTRLGTPRVEFATTEILVDGSAAGDHVLTWRDGSGAADLVRRHVADPCQQWRIGGRRVWRGWADDLPDRSS